ncbi:hypothetical protein L2E82_01319 [Cichorium intybus]|uniref:Uncharacterized protein n=1 Tax=Cichorium intybus TaxID=13427 RepID=A0ACB9GYJ1_CICIN|nr:hypothetical protein L2E82_01319 [Cichorium intybus]
MSATFLTQQLSNPKFLLTLPSLPSLSSHSSASIDVGSLSSHSSDLQWLHIHPSANLIQYGLECLWASSSGCRGDLFLIDTKFCQFLLAVETSLDWKTFYEVFVLYIHIYVEALQNDIY